MRALVPSILAALSCFCGAASAEAPVQAGTEELFAVHRAGEPKPGGWARLARGVDAGGTAWFELELALEREEVVLHQVERVGAQELEVVYRERRPGGGRTLRARWSGPATRARSERVEWAGRERLSAMGEGARPDTPLALGDAARAGRLGVQSGACYVAVADAEETWEHRTWGVSVLLGPLAARISTWRDARGDVRAWRLVAACETLAFGFAPGSPVAVRCSRERFDGLRAADRRPAPAE